MAFSYENSKALTIPIDIIKKDFVTSPNIFYDEEKEQSLNTLLNGYTLKQYEKYTVLSENFSGKNVILSHKYNQIFPLSNGYFLASCGPNYIFQSFVGSEINKSGWEIIDKWGLIVDGSEAKDYKLINNNLIQYTNIGERFIVELTENGIKKKLFSFDDMNGNNCRPVDSPLFLTGKNGSAVIGRDGFIVKPATDYKYMGEKDGYIVLISEEEFSNGNGYTINLVIPNGKTTYAVFEREGGNTSEE